MHRTAAQAPGLFDVTLHTRIATVACCLPAGCHTGSTMTVDVSHHLIDENGEAPDTLLEVTVSDSHAGKQRVVGEWLGPPEAEQRLGISERTLYRRIAAGRLKKRVLDDGRIEVWVSVPVTDADSHQAPSQNGHSATDGGFMTDSDRQHTSERALALMDRFNAALARQVEPLVQELADTRRQLVELAEQTGRLTERTEHLIAERDELLRRVDHLERELADSRVSATVGQTTAVESGHDPDAVLHVSVTDSHQPLASSGQPTPSEIASSEPTATLMVEVAQESATNSHAHSRPWWRFW
jgi:hypothetical protein